MPIKRIKEDSKKQKSKHRYSSTKSKDSNSSNKTKEKTIDNNKRKETANETKMDAADARRNGGIICTYDNSQDLLDGKKSERSISTTEMPEKELLIQTLQDDSSHI